MEYFDTHAHYNDEKFDGIVDDVLVLHFCALLKLKSRKEEMGTRN